MEPACSASLPLLPALMWLLLYILSCRTSVRLDFGQFGMMVILQFSCIFDVVVGWFQHHEYLDCHLDWKLPNILKYTYSTDEFWQFDYLYFGHLKCHCYRFPGKSSGKIAEFMNSRTPHSLFVLPSHQQSLCHLLTIPKQNENCLPR